MYLYPSFARPVDTMASADAMMIFSFISPEQVTSYHELYPMAGVSAKPLSRLMALLVRLPTSSSVTSSILIFHSGRTVGPVVASLVGQSIGRALHLTPQHRVVDD
eukprot:scpid69468/ scgid9749/ 